MPRLHRSPPALPSSGSTRQFWWTARRASSPGTAACLRARKLELTEVPVIVLDHLTETQKRAYIIADNQLAVNAGWDADLLRLELAALQEEDFDVSLIGFDDEELARLLAAQDATEGLTDEDAIPALPKLFRVRDEQRYQSLVRVRRIPRGPCQAAAAS
jgi:hypothetical protein